MQHLVDRGLRSQRRAANLVGMHRSVARYRSCRETDSTLRERLKELATQYPRYGYETLHGLLKLEGRVINEKRTYRIYREEHLQVRRKRRKRLTRQQRVPMPMVTRVNQRWSMDFVSDQLAVRGGSTFSELRWYPPVEAAKGSLSWVFRAKQPESVRTGP